MTTLASRRLRNHSIDKHSSRNFPLKLSFVPFCQGLPAINSNDITPLQLAESLGHIECVTLLANYVNFQSFYQALLMQDFELAKYILIEHHETFCLFSLTNEHNETALHLVACHNQADLVTQLVKAGANLAALDKKSRTPIMAAADNMAYDAVEAFADAVDEKNDSYGYGAAMLSVYFSGKYTIADKLLARKANVNYHRGDGITCLVMSCSNARKDDIIKFLTFGANPKIGPDRNNRPAAILAMNSKWDCMQAFLSVIKVEDNQNDRLRLGYALALAIDDGEMDVALRLIELKANVGYTLNESNCLHLAIQKKLFPLLKPLLWAGANPNKPNKKNVTVITMADTYDEQTRRSSRFSLFSRPVFIKIAVIIAEVAAERAAASAPALSLSASHEVLRPS